jgi:hypothetical protein
MTIFHYLICIIIFWKKLPNPKAKSEIMCVTAVVHSNSESIQTAAMRGVNLQSLELTALRARKIWCIPMIGLVLSKIFEKLNSKK